MMDIKILPTLISLKHPSRLWLKNTRIRDPTLNTPKWMSELWNILKIHLMLWSIRELLIQLYVVKDPTQMLQKCYHKFIEFYHKMGYTLWYPSILKKTEILIWKRQILIGEFKFRKFKSQQWRLQLQQKIKKILRRTFITCTYVLRERKMKKLLRKQLKRRNDLFRNKLLSFLFNSFILFIFELKELFICAH